MTGEAVTLRQLMHGQRLRYTAALAALAVSIFVLYLPPLVTRAAIDGIIRQDPTAEIPRWVMDGLRSASARWTERQMLAVAGGVVLLLTAFSGVLNYLRGRWTALASESIARGLRQRLYDHLQHLPCEFYDHARTGDLIQRCTADVEMVRGLFAGHIVEIARAAVLSLTALPILLALDWRMTLAATSLMPVLIAFACIFFFKIRRSFEVLDEAEGAMTTALQENLTGIRVVRGFCRQEFEKRRFAQRNLRHRRLNERLFTVTALYWSASDLLCLCQIAVVLFVGAWQVSAGRLSVGSLVAFLAYAGMVIWPMRQAGRILSDVGKAMVSFDRIRAILLAPRESETPLVRPASRPRRLKGRIVFKDVCFSYGQKRVFDRVTLTVHAGETLAIVGPSGSGKSTLLNLLLRFYDHDRGSILLDGHELRQLERGFVRGQIGVVMQEPFLYSRSLRENIKLARHEADDRAMIEAATMACIHDSIEDFDRQYDTLVGERGVTLSGGQRQRVAIARALLKDDPILVLDDALSAVDTRTEAMILKALNRRRRRRTTLVIAHRLSTLAAADRIAVLDRGRIVQCGTHDELIVQPGLYRRLWHLSSPEQELELNKPMRISRSAAAVDDLSAA